MLRPSSLLVTNITKLRKKEKKGDKRRRRRRRIRQEKKKKKKKKKRTETREEEEEEEEKSVYSIRERVFVEVILRKGQPIEDIAVFVVLGTPTRKHKKRRRSISVAGWPWRPRRTSERRFLLIPGRPQVAHPPAHVALARSPSLPPKLSRFLGYETNSSHFFFFFFFVVLVRRQTDEQTDRQKNKNKNQRSASP
jgi:hypothetical protein